MLESLPRARTEPSHGHGQEVRYLSFRALAFPPRLCILYE